MRLFRDKIPIVNVDAMGAAAINNCEQYPLVFLETKSSSCYYDTVITLLENRFEDTHNLDVVHYSAGITCSSAGDRSIYVHWAHGTGNCEYTPYKLPTFEENLDIAMRDLYNNQVLGLFYDTFTGSSYFLPYVFGFIPEEFLKKTRRDWILHSCLTRLLKRLVKVEPLGDDKAHISLDLLDCFLDATAHIEKLTSRDGEDEYYFSWRGHLFYKRRSGWYVYPFQDPCDRTLDGNDPYKYNQSYEMHSVARDNYKANMGRYVFKTNKKSGTVISRDELIDMAKTTSLLKGVFK